MNVREAMMDSVASKLDLTELGTRYDHYMELKEVFMLGVDVLDRMNPNYRGAADNEIHKRLTNAVDMISKRLDYLSEFSDKSLSLAREVRAAGIHRPLLLMEGADDKQKNTSEPDNSKAAGDPSTDAK